jgi:hypothetical protein
MSGLAPPPNGSSAGLDAAQLWERMLSVQRVFGCYNSARMRAALEAEDREVVCQLRREPLVFFLFLLFFISFSLFGPLSPHPVCFCAYG